MPEAFAVDNTALGCFEGIVEAVYCLGESDAGIVWRPIQKRNVRHKT